MFKHWQDRSSESKTEKLRDFFRRLGENINWEDVFVFLHLSIAWVFFTWGLEILLPWTVWRIMTGIYIMLWVGTDLIKLLWSKGFYLLKDSDTE